jgi:hypothetical protein
MISYSQLKDVYSYNKVESQSSSIKGSTISSKDNVNLIRITVLIYV